MSAIAVVTYLENNCVGQSYVWDPGGQPGSVHLWLTTTPQGAQPVLSAAKLNCFGLPFMAAVLSNSLTWQQASDMYSDGLNSNGAHVATRGTEQPPGEWCNGPVGGFYRGTFCCIPVRRGAMNRGDLVFFSGTGSSKYLAHVAIATGNGTDCVSFGHGAHGQGVACPVESMTVDEIYESFHGTLTAAFTAAPAW